MCVFYSLSLGPSSTDIHCIWLCLNCCYLLNNSLQWYDYDHSPAVQCNIKWANYMCFCSSTVLLRHLPTFYTTTFPLMLHKLLESIKSNNNLTKLMRNFISSLCTWLTLWSYNTVIDLSSMPTSDWLLWKGLLAHELGLKHLLSSLTLLHILCATTCVREHVRVWVCGIGVREEAGGILHDPLCIIVIRFPKIAQLSRTAPGTRWFVVWHSLTGGPVC